MPFWVIINFQTLVSFTSSYLESLNDFTLVWMFFILIVVFSLSFFIVFNTPFGVLKLEKISLELFWTIFPIFILVSIALPSLFLLNLQDVSVPKSIFKAVGNQWNWQSETNEENDHLLDFMGVFFKSSFETPMMLNMGKVQSIVTSSDVLHSFGIPELGIKIDSSPGRLNSVFLDFIKPGMYWGSCYELCGSGHSSMPFSILVLSFVLKF